MYHFREMSIAEIYHFVIEQLKNANDQLQFLESIKAQGIDIPRVEGKIEALKTIKNKLEFTYGDHDGHSGWPLFL